MAETLRNLVRLHKLGWKVDHKFAILYVRKVKPTILSEEVVDFSRKYFWF